jgi:hypothetical protein
VSIAFINFLFGPQNCRLPRVHCFDKCRVWLGDRRDVDSLVSIAGWILCLAGGAGGLEEYELSNLVHEADIFRDQSNLIF